MRGGDRLTLRIEKAVAGGRMLARHDGAVVLVAGAIPGETVEAEIERTQRRTVWASTRHVIEASADRVEPFCDRTCGGSVYAHIAYERQIDLKRDVLRDTFARVGRIGLDRHIPAMASRPNGYRMRARVHVRRGQLGFFREGTHELCDLAATRQLLPETSDVLGRLAASLKRAGLSRTEIEISENRDAAERACHIELEPDSDPSRLAGPAEVEGLRGVSCGHRHQSRALTLWGSPDVTDTIDGVRLTRQARAFFQGNRFLLADLVSHVLDTVPAGPALDLYAGVGLFSVALAARGSGPVTAVEGDATSADDLKRNAAPFGGAIAARQQPVELFLGSHRARGTFAVAIVDPPRTGMTTGAIQGLIALKPSRIVYVSCDVATLARDARILTDSGYALERLEAFDMFPNTAHVESVAVFDS